MFRRRFKDGQNNTARLFYKKLKDSKSVKDMLIWARRNFPEVEKEDK